MSFDPERGDRMKVLMLHNRYQIGGGEDVSTELQVALLRDGGHDVVLYEETNERVVDIGSTRTAGRALWSREAHHRVDAILSAGDFDVMHVQNFFPLLSPSVYYAANRHGVPVVQSLRNFRLVCPEGMLHRDGRFCNDCVGKFVAWPSVKHSCYRDSRAGSAVIATMNTTHRVAGTWKRKVDLYVTPSAYAQSVFVDAGWDPHLMTTIPNFVAPDPGVGTGTGGFALYAGRLAPAKGIDIMIEAWEHHGVTAPLKIVGDGALRPLVERAAQRLPTVEYLGPRSIDETIALMGDASFVVVPTVGIETFGRVAAEAQARGTPAIVSDLGGLADIVEDGVTGHRFPPGNAHQLASLAETMWTGRTSDRAMRSAARASYESRYSVAAARTQWDRAYSTVIAASRKNEHRDRTKRKAN